MIKMLFVHDCVTRRIFLASEASMVMHAIGLRCTNAQRKHELHNITVINEFMKYHDMAMFKQMKFYERMLLGNKGLPTIVKIR